ncbi:putative MFS transporter [Biscogniauxia sp. FL1348]|nr:putative MFS transporter [Biscogniauxia sp. FL1348]
MAHPEIIPGTVVIYTSGEDGEIRTENDLVLIPQPTSHPDDPLNWSKTWKTIILVNQSVFVFVSIMTPLAIAPMTQIFEHEFHKTLPEVNMLFGAAAITLGYANFLIVPAANVLGRRPVILVCSLVCILANVWQGLVTSYSSFIAARVVSGLGAAANESIMPMVIADLLFQHQRGSSMALYFWAYFLGLFLGPIISGAIAAQISWRWFFWVCTILQGASFVFLLVAHPETKYNRPSPSLSPPSSSSTTLSPTITKDEVSPDSTSTSPSPKPDDKHLSTSSHQPQSPPATDPTPTPTPNPTGRPTPLQFSVLPAPRLFPQHPGGRMRALVRDVASPLRILVLYPIVTWASLAMGLAANALLGLNLTQAPVFGGPRYGFGPDRIGYVNLAFAAGAGVGLVSAGPFSDAVALRRARRPGRRGVLEAEMRLPALVPYVCVNVVGMVVVALGYQRGWPWEAVVILGYTLVGLQVVGIPAIAIAYAIDCYKTLPGEIMIAATIVKNTFGFGMIFYFNDWAARDGYLGPVLMLMGCTVGICIVGLATFIPFGKQFRRWTKDSDLHTL